eukprot:SAG31_NODE_31015_length_373_cov_1.072993_1_plen_80_part_00
MRMVQELCADCVFCRWACVAERAAADAHSAGGCYVSNVVSMDPHGSIPGFLKAKMGDRHVHMIEHMRDFILEGKIPKNQ